MKQTAGEPSFTPHACSIKGIQKIWVYHMNNTRHLSCIRSQRVLYGRGPSHAPQRGSFEEGGAAVVIIEGSGVFRVAINS